MTAATEGYVDARTDAIWAETAETVTRALLSFERATMQLLRWMVGIVLAAVTASTAITIALTS